MGDTWQVIETVGTEEEAALIAGFLKSRGIEVGVESLRFHQEPVNFGRLGEVRLRVAEEQVEEARRLLGERRARYDLVPGGEGEGRHENDENDENDENEGDEGNAEGGGADEEEAGLTRSPPAGEEP